MINYHFYFTDIYIFHLCIPCRTFKVLKTVQPLQQKKSSKYNNFCNFFLTQKNANSYIFTNICLRPLFHELNYFNFNSKKIKSSPHSLAKVNLTPYSSLPLSSHCRVRYLWQEGRKKGRKKGRGKDQLLFQRSNSILKFN